MAGDSEKRGSLLQSESDVTQIKFFSQGFKKGENWGTLSFRGAARHWILIAASHAPPGEYAVMNESNPGALGIPECMLPAGGETFKVRKLLVKEE